MKSIVNRRGSKRITVFFRNASASYDKQKRLDKAERQKNIDKGEKKAC